MVQLFTLLVGLLVSAGLVRGQSLPFVQLAYSTIQAISYNATGDFYLYKNIRYAAPPLGSLRFQEPQPPYLETTVNNGSIGGNRYTQEDCLCLDIYVPASVVAGSNLSVVV